MSNQNQALYEHSNLFQWKGYPPRIGQINEVIKSRIGDKVGGLKVINIWFKLISSRHISDRLSIKEHKNGKRFKEGSRKMSQAHGTQLCC